MRVRRGLQTRGRGGRVRGRVHAGLRARCVHPAGRVPLRLRLRGRQLHHSVPVQRPLALRGSRQARQVHRVPQQHDGECFIRFYNLQCMMNSVKVILLMLKSLRRYPRI